jgi:hypothetical protein
MNVAHARDPGDELRSLHRGERSATIIDRLSRCLYDSVQNSKFNFVQNIVTPSTDL